MNDFPVKRMGDGWTDTPHPTEAKTTQDIAHDARAKLVQIEGRDWKVRATDPYGFWRVEDPTGGPVATQLNGSYTGIDQAINAIRQYMSENPVSPAKKEAVEKGTTPPVLKTKKVVKKPQVETSTVNA